MSARLCFAVINESTITDPGFGGELTTPILQEGLDALATYANSHVADEYGGRYDFRIVAALSDVPSGQCAVRIVNSVAQVAPGAAAFHDRTADGSPIIYVARDEFDSLLDGGFNLLSFTSQHQVLS
jgi:hypothetical protein